MATDEHIFCRSHLGIVMGDVVKSTTPEQRKKAWAWRYEETQLGEFHGPDGFYWHGRACCRWAARAEGWQAYLDQL